MSDYKNHNLCPNEELSEELIKEKIFALATDWNLLREPNRLVKEFKFKDFKKALEFTNRLGDLAEKENHHPDIFLSWGLVRVEFWTHNANGLTDLDFALARQTDQLIV
jgi:4a-hydroxytetrahydrobiopterin dehydratase